MKCKQTDEYSRNFAVFRKLLRVSRGEDEDVSKFSCALKKKQFERKNYNLQIWVVLRI